MLITMSDGLDHLAVIPGVSGVGIGEQQHQIDFIVSDAGVDLLMAALLMGQKQGNGQTGVIRDQAAGGGGGVEIMLGKQTLICGTELHHQFFLLVMGQECDIHNVHSFLKL